MKNRMTDHLGDVVKDAMDELESMHGPKGAQYLKIMRAIRDDAQKRLDGSVAIYTQGIAREFSKGVRETLSEEDLAWVISRNSVEDHPSVCHTHDFCDANDIMAAAFEKIMGAESQADSQADADMWNTAWNIAKILNFRME